MKHHTAEALSQFLTYDIDKSAQGNKLPVMFTHYAVFGMGTYSSEVVEDKKETRYMPKLQKMNAF